MGRRGFSDDSMKVANNVSPVAEGEVISGRYRVDKVLGVGGMGVVVAATDQRLGSPVAIKFLLPHALEHAEIVARFSREARAAVRIKSEHVARVMDVGTLESGAPYMVMEHLEGRDLSTELQNRGGLAVEDVVDFVLQASEALVEAHHLGFVHRDLKPANLFLVDTRSAPVVKVLDFGISKINSMVGVTGSDAAVTQTASVLGSPLYMSPEQMDSARNVDLRTDIWALGVIFYELLTGEPPFTGESIPQLCMAILKQTPQPIRATRRDVPARLEAVVFRCLEKDRERRFASVEELAVALAEFAPPRSRISLERISASSGALPNLRDSAGNSARTGTFSDGVSDPKRGSGRGSGRRVADSLDERPEGGTQATWGRTSSERRSPFFFWVVFGIPAVLGIGLLLFLFAHHGAGTPAASESTAPGSASVPAAAAVPEVATHPAPDPERPMVSPAPLEAVQAPVVAPPTVLPPPLVTGRPRTKPKPASAAAPEPATAKPGHAAKPAHGDESWENER
jgi:serine/threonine-protein kinase